MNCVGSRDGSGGSHPRNALTATASRATVPPPRQKSDCPPTPRSCDLSGEIAVSAPRPGLAGPIRPRSSRYHESVEANTVVSFSNRKRAFSRPLPIANGRLSRDPWLIRPSGPPSPEGGGKRFEEGHDSELPPFKTLQNHIASGSFGPHPPLPRGVGSFPTPSGGRTEKEAAMEAHVPGKGRGEGNRAWRQCFHDLSWHDCPGRLRKHRERSTFPDLVPWLRFVRGAENSRTDCFGASLA